MAPRNSAVCHLGVALPAVGCRGRKQVDEVGLDDPMRGGHRVPVQRLPSLTLDVHGESPRIAGARCGLPDERGEIIQKTDTQDIDARHVIPA